MQGKNPHWPKAQRGMSKWGWLTVAILAVFALTATLRLGPHYIDFRILQSVLDRLPENDVHKNMTRDDINDFMHKQMRIENFHTPVRELMKIERSRDQTVLNVDYEIREHLFFNVDVVLVFSEQRTYQ